MSGGTTQFEQNDALAGDRTNDSSSTFAGQPITFNTILNSIFFEKIEITRMTLLTHGLQFIGLLIIAYLITPQYLFYILLIVIFIVLALIYLVSQASLQSNKFGRPVNVDKLDELRRSLKQRMHSQ
ncbi:hypothetical protein KP791_000077 [Venturia canescens]|uniref:Uncharacterized protein n=1 Tax=Venturia canescens TaxID=32260 RepID=A0ACB9ZI38_9HYME|nr:hypothetical protein KP791_000077 [Venturia canescens]